MVPDQTSASTRRASSVVPLNTLPPFPTRLWWPGSSSKSPVPAFPTLLAVSGGLDECRPTMPAKRRSMKLSAGGNGLCPSVSGLGGRNLGKSAGQRSLGNGRRAGRAETLPANAGVPVPRVCLSYLATTPSLDQGTVGHNLAGGSYATTSLCQTPPECLSFRAGAAVSPYGRPGVIFYISRAKRSAPCLNGHRSVESAVFEPGRRSGWTRRFPVPETGGNQVPTLPATGSVIDLMDALPLKRR